MELYTRWAVAALHLLGVAIAIGAVWGRGRALRSALDEAGLKRVFYCDNWWGVAALALYGTGLPRAFMALEKGTDYYLANQLFWLKLGLLLVAGIMEVWPMIDLWKWRTALGKGITPDTRHARRWGLWSYVEAACMVGAVLAATAVARGFGLPG